MQKQILHQRTQLYPLTVKVDPRVKQSWLLVILGGVACVISGLMAIGLIPTMSHPSFVQTIYFMGLVCTSIISLRSWKRIEQKRQTAAQGDQRLLADIQLMPNAQALPLPLTIRMRPRWSLVIGLPVGLIFLFVSMLTPFFVMTYSSQALAQKFTQETILLLVLTSLMLLSIISIFVNMYTEARKQITLTEHGIMQTGISPKIQNIPWSEVRLFALSSPAGQVTFELASMHEQIRWKWLYAKGFSLSSAKPVTSPAEYEQQMFGVIALVEAKTGLPLYDLRKKL